MCVCVCSCTYSIVVNTINDKVLCYTCSDHSLVASGRDICTCSDHSLSFTTEFQLRASFELTAEDCIGRCFMAARDTASSYPHADPDENGMYTRWFIHDCPLKHECSTLAATAITTTTNTTHTTHNDNNNNTAHNNQQHITRPIIIEPHTTTTTMTTLNINKHTNQQHTHQHTNK